jgi:hypothetical protein
MIIISVCSRWVHKYVHWPVRRIKVVEVVEEVHPTVFHPINAKEVAEEAVMEAAVEVAAVVVVGDEVAAAEEEEEI